MPDKKTPPKRENKKFDTKDYKSMFVIGTKEGGDSTFVERYMHGDLNEIILAFGTIIQELPAFRHIVQTALSTVMLKEAQQNGDIN